MTMPPWIGAGPRSARPSDPLTLDRPGTPESPSRSGSRLFVRRGRAVLRNFAASSRRLCRQGHRRDPRVVKRRPALLPLALGAAMVAGLAGCRSSSQAANTAATGSAGAAAPKASYLTLPPSQMGHVQVVAAKTANWPHLLRLTGTVDYNQFTTSPVLSQVNGPVRRILVAPGEQVRAGQPLVEVSSPDYAQARNTYLKAHDSLVLAKQVYRRDADLYAHRAIAQADVEQAENAQSQAQADFAAATQALEILGVARPETLLADAPAPTLAIKAPIAGTVVERDIAPGQLLQAGTTQCFVISNMSTVWVLANVYQSDLAYVHVGDPVEIDTDAYPQPFHGTIQFLSPSLDPTTRTLQARIATRNPGGELKKQMYVTVLVHAGTARNLVVVPDDAVLRDGQNEPFVYLQSSIASNQFVHRGVTLGESENGETAITSGLQPGERVVGNGAMFLQFANALEP